MKSRTWTNCVGFILGAILTLAAPLSAQWEVSSTSDRMTGAVTHFARSPSTEGEGFVGAYDGVRAYLVYACNTTRDWVNVFFSTTPNLTSTTNHDGYERIQTRVRWGDRLDQQTFRQEWGSSLLQFDRGVGRAIAYMESEPTMLLELPWFGSGRVYFEFSLRGSSAAMGEARSQCGLGEPADLTGTVPRSQARIAADPQIKIYFPIEDRCWQRRIPDEDVVFFASEEAAIAAGFRKPRIGCQ